MGRSVQSGSEMFSAHHVTVLWSLTPIRPVDEFADWVGEQAGKGCEAIEGVAGDYFAQEQDNAIDKKYK